MMDPQMMKGQPQGMPTQEAPAAAGPEELISDIHSGLVDLMGMMNKTKVATPADKQKLAILTKEFQSLIEGLGQEQPAPTGPASPEAGIQKVQPAL